MSPTVSRSFKCLIGMCALVITFMLITACPQEPEPRPTPQPTPQPAPQPAPSKATVIKGRVVNSDPEVGPMEGVEIAAMLQQNAVASTMIDPKTGKYSIEVSQPGTYSLRLKTPMGVVPFAYAVEVKSGQTATAPDIDLPVGALPPSPKPPTPAPVPKPPEPVPTPKPPVEAAVLSGTANVPEVEIKVIDQGKVVATGKAAGGKFTLPNVPAGVYKVEFSAPGYATEVAQNVAVSSQGAVRPLNAFLLYRSSLDGVDYDKGIVTATGLGKANPKMPKPQASLMACRAAKVLAYRALLDTILGIQVEKGKSVRDLDKGGSIKSRLGGYVSGATVLKQEKHDDGSCELTLQMPLRGAAGVTKFLQTVIEK